MAKLTSFELQTYQNNQWKIDSVFDDKQLAVYEAQRLQNAGRYSGIRVVQEIFDEESGTSQTRIAFRGSKVEAVNAQAREKAQAQSAEISKARARQAEARKAGIGENRAGGASAGNPIFQIISLGAIVVAGVVLILFLRHISQMV